MNIPNMTLRSGIFMVCHLPKEIETTRWIRLRRRNYFVRNRIVSLTVRFHEKSSARFRFDSPRYLSDLKLFSNCIIFSARFPSLYGLKYIGFLPPISGIGGKSEQKSGFPAAIISKRMFGQHSQDDAKMRALAPEYSPGSLS